VILHPTDFLALVGQVSDDGLPAPPGTVTTTWSQGDGPGIVTFGDASSLGTTATFPLQGKYQLRLTGDDGDKTASDSVVVRYANAGNGNTVAVQTPGTTFFEAEDYAYLYGSAQKLNDIDASGSSAIQVPDGSGTHAFSEHTLSVTEQNVTFYVWIRGKGFDLNSDSVLVSFMDSPDRQVTLSSDNTYGWFQVPGSFTTPAGIWPLIIRAGEDGVIWDRVAFTTDPSFVPEGNQINTFEARVSASADDAEESATGKVSLTSADLELVFDGNNQTVGMRFNSINIPKNATITKAYLQFKVDERNSEATALTVQGQNTDNAAIFTTAARNISSRAKTAAMVSWNPVPWTTVGQAGVDQQTTNIAPIIQEIVHRPGWALGNSLAIIISGTGHRTAEAFNGDKAGAPLLHVEYSTETQANQAPVVNAGLDQSISLPNNATLSGTVTDDGLPANSSVTSTWSKSSGPGAVSFANAQALNTTASFSEAGTYMLRLTADDGNLAAFDEVTITVNAANAANVAPVLATIGDKTVTVNSLLSCTATATDANSGDILTFSFVNAPADAITTSSGAFSWTPSAAGTYAFTVKVCDNAATPLCDEELVTVTVNEAGATSTINVRVAGGSDDAEQVVSTGAVALASSDLELTVDGTNQTVGMRFNSIAIPKGAVIQNAYIQFTVDETPSVAETLQVWGQAADNAATFTTAANNISSRPKTTASATWNPAAWPTLGAAGVDQQTPDIKAVIQEIVNRSGWTSGNSLAVIITGDGNGKRVAEAFEGLPSAAPQLHVEFAASGDPGNTTPDVNITAPGTGSTFAAGTSISFAGTAADSEDGSLTGSSLNWTSSIDNNIGSGASFSKVLTTGTHTITASVTDSGGLTGSAQITVTVNPPVGAGSVDIRVSSGSDDAEQAVTTGAMSLTSSDLELTLDAANQIVGMRFNLVNIPKGATIDSASIQFTVDQVNTAEVTALTISGQAADNAATFTTASSNISLRPTTAASVLWSPVPGWTTVGLAGPGQKTPDLKTVIQEIVNRSGWVSGNSLVVIITGSGKRVARAFNGVASAAPLLHVDYH
ncbi:MAG: putative Ig domain-containing protein, partial [Methylobacter sp.]